MYLALTYSYVWCRTFTVECKAIPIVFIKQDEPDRVCSSVAMMRIVTGYGSTFLEIGRAHV